MFYLVPESAFIQATAITQAASHLGYVTAAELSEVAIVLLHMSLTGLLWVSLVAILAATALTVALPGQPHDCQVSPTQLRARGCTAISTPRSDRLPAPTGGPSRTPHM